MKSRFNNLPLGLILGIIAPVLTMVIVYYARFSDYVFNELIEFLLNTQIFTKIVSLCVIPNLVFFFIFIRFNYLYSARGVLLATILFAIFVFITKFAF